MAPPPSQEWVSRPGLISPKAAGSSVNQKASLKGILNTQNQTFTEFEAKKSVEFNDKSTEIFNYKNRSIKSSVQQHSQDGHAIQSVKDTLSAKEKRTKPASQHAQAVPKISQALQQRAKKPMSNKPIRQRERESLENNNRFKSTKTSLTKEKAGIPKQKKSSIPIPNRNKSP